MNATRFLLAGLFLLSWNIVVPGQHDVAQAQSTCACPAGYPGYDSRTNTCNSGYPSFLTVPLICRSNPAGIGQAAATLQQGSFSTVAGVMQSVRDGLQGNKPAGSGSGITPYSRVDFDESFGLLDYASSTKPKNPLAYLKAPAAAPVDPGPKWAVWSEAFGDWERRGPLNADDVGRKQASGGAHVGIDAIWQNNIAAGDFVVGGLLGSWLKTNVTLVGPPGGFTLEGPGVGAYSMYILGPFSVDLTAKADFLSLREDFGGFFPTAATDVTNAGLSGNVQYKNKIGSTGYFEPTAGFSLTRTMFGDNAASLGLQDATTVRVQGGARFGNTFTVNGIIIEPILGLLVYENVVAEGTSITTTPIAIPIAPTDRGLVRGEVDPELNFDFNNGYSAYVRGLVRFGNDMLGINAKMGVRKQF
jgi:hypothetical protein